MKIAVLISFLITAVGTLILLTWDLSAFPTYSVNRDATRCRNCHGDFRSDNYISKKDGQNWGNLHDLHRIVMLNRDCNTCHSGSTRFPVSLSHSNGGTGLYPIACVGCHGRTEDAGNDSRSAGLGAGLRQRHTVSGVTVCMNCHTDANPLNYTPVAESVPPPYYFEPDEAHPNKPTNACNSFGEEDYLGDIFGLDNDGDGVPDVLDSDCKPPFGTIEICHRNLAKKRSQQTVTVNAASLRAHLYHGDTLGPCSE